MAHHAQESQLLHDLDVLHEELGPALSAASSSSSGVSLLCTHLLLSSTPHMCVAYRSSGPPDPMPPDSQSALHVQHAGTDTCALYSRIDTLHVMSQRLGRNDQGMSE